jgi:hypothetical protein
MQLYWTTPEQEINCAAFETFMRRFHWVEFIQPSPEKAPWHVQAWIRCANNYVVIVNFWPHKLKGQYDGQAVEGMDALAKMLWCALDGKHDPDDCTVIEDEA